MVVNCFGIVGYATISVPGCAQALADYARFPEDRSGQRYPWPLV